MKDTKLLIVGIALISALMLVTGTITVIPTAIAAQQEEDQEVEEIARTKVLTVKSQKVDMVIKPRKCRLNGDLLRQLNRLIDKLLFLVIFCKFINSHYNT